MLQLNHENEMGQVTFLGKGQKVTRNTVLSVHLMGGEEKLTVASSARSRPCSGRASSAAGSGLSLRGSPAPRQWPQAAAGGNTVTSLKVKV